MKNSDHISSPKLLERFIRYARIWTTSDAHIDSSPTTERQWDLLNLLKEELLSLDVQVELDSQGFLIGRIPGRGAGANAPVVGFMAHVDTAADVSGKDVKPRVHEAWDGSPIVLENGITLDPAELDDLGDCLGQTIITSDGTTLLGADDKAGIAEIMAAVEYLSAHPEIDHGPLEIIFTPDEETGKGMDRFPREKLKSRCCYTLDGDVRGTMEAECFNAWKAHITFNGIAAHPGRARGRLVNALSMLGMFINLLPRTESPEATDGRYGFFHTTEASGHMEKAELSLIIRDFEISILERRLKALDNFASAVEAAFPGGKVEVQTQKQYLNMREAFQKDPLVLDLAYKAIESLGLDARYTAIRGGTDGARLSEIGIPTPNLFTGGHNFHSLREWASLETMTFASEMVLSLISLWASIDGAKSS